MYRESDRPKAVEVVKEVLRVTLADGRVIETPMAWYPALEAATPTQRAHVVLLADGVHWPDVDEYLSVSGMLAGIRPVHPRRQKVA